MERPIDRPRFSIVVPAYQAESTLGETLAAIANQSFDDWECIVVDDGSTDGTLRVAQGFAAKDARIRAIAQTNTGTAGAYNTGVGNAVGEFVVICSADDILLPEHCAAMSSFIESEPGYDIYSSNGYFWEPRHDRELVYKGEAGSAVCSFELSDLIRRCFYSVGAAYRRELHDRVGGYRTGVYGEDYDFWLRAMATGARHRYLPVALSCHRISATQKSAALEKVFRSDIALLTDLRARVDLKPNERIAVEEAIGEREALIAELRRPRGAIHSTARAVAYQFLGPRRARRLAQTVRSLTPRR